MISAGGPRKPQRGGSLRCLIVVPGWYATYWIKMLSDVEVLESGRKARPVPERVFSFVIADFGLRPRIFLLPKSALGGVGAALSAVSSPKTFPSGEVLGGGIPKDHGKNRFAASRRLRPSRPARCRCGSAVWTAEREETRDRPSFSLPPLEF